MKSDLRKILLIAFIFSGVAALVYEVTWIRPLQFLLGSTIYTVSIIFAAFMLGLALGSLIASTYADKLKNLPKTYALLEIGIGLYGVLLLSIFNFLPDVYDSLYFLHPNFYIFEIVQFLLVFIVLLVPTTLMGATFPVIVKYYTEHRIGKGVGEVYAANNLGAIFGSFAAGFILIPLVGIKASIIFAGAINILVAGIILVKSDKEFFKKQAIVFLILFAALAFFGNYSIKQMHSGGFSRTSDIQEDWGDVVYYKEGLYATVTVRELPDEGYPTKAYSAYSLFINGKGQGSYVIRDLRVNLLLAYLPVLTHPESENALVIGLGTGTTSGQLSELINVTTIEIEPEILGAAPYFKVFNLDVLENPNHNLIIDDGRNHLLRNTEKYDVIIPEPSDPWQSFSTALFSKEFFELASEDLEENGLYLQWAPIYQMSPEDFKDFYKTFSSVFPNVVAFANIKPDEDTPVRFRTGEIILVGSKQEIKINEEIFSSNYNLLPEISKQYLGAIDLGSGKKVYHLLLFTGEQMRGYADDAKLITDDKPILEFSSARKVFAPMPQEVIDDIHKFLEKNVG